MLEEAIRRLQEEGALKLWVFEDEREYDADTFRQRVYARHLSGGLLQLPPGSANKEPKTDAEAAFRQRMIKLQLKILLPSLDQGQEGQPAKSAKGGRHRAVPREQHETTRITNIRTISTILGALNKVSLAEHCMLHAVSGTMVAQRNLETIHKQP